MVILKFLKTIRNNWKKTVFGVAAVSYGASEAQSKYEINNLMRAYCSEASTFGDELHNIFLPNKKIIVLLNPAADKKSAEKTFQTYCDPILQLSGYIVDVVSTDSEGHARRYVQELETLPHAILVAGGDGTVSEVVTGLMRRPNGDKCPIGILPVGRTNSTASKFFNLPTKPDDVQEAEGLAKTAIAVLRGKVERKDILEVQPLVQDAEETSLPKSIYALGQMQWGAYRDAKSLQDKYWYVGPFRNYAAVLFNSLSSKLTWDCSATLTYTPPCEGCKNCHIAAVEAKKVELPQRWWKRFVPTKRSSPLPNNQIDYSKIQNENCSKEYNAEINTSEVILSTAKDSAGNSKIVVKSQETVESGFDFVSNSWKRINTNEENEFVAAQTIESRTLVLTPKVEEAEAEEGANKFYFIDNEEYEVRPIKISLVPNAIDVYSL